MKFFVKLLAFIHSNTESYVCACARVQYYNISKGIDTYLHYAHASNGH
jgi:hypothetical protein